MLYNAKHKLYGNSICSTYCSASIFNPDKEKFPHPPVNKLRIHENGESVRSDSLRRAKLKVRDIAYANLSTWQYFITFTLDQKHVDRYDPLQVKQKLQSWLRNRVNRSDLSYLLIPEHHKDGAIHFHGLCNNIPIVDSGKKDKHDHIIFNCPSWTLGFSTCIALYGNLDKAVNYILKYITKDAGMIFGNFYLAGGKIEREVPVEYSSENFHDIQAKEHHAAFAPYRFKYISVNQGG